MVGHGLDMVCHKVVNLGQTGHTPIGVSYVLLGATPCNGFVEGPLVGFGQGYFATRQKS